MWLLIVLVLLIAVILKYLNRDYFLLAGCRRIKTADGSDLEKKAHVIPGKTIFGNNLDLLQATAAITFNYARTCAGLAKGKSFIQYFLFSPIYGITNAEDAEEVLQSQSLITKGKIYDIVKPFLGLGLLINTDDQWQFRRKILTPAFHFTILQTFLEVFKEESHKFIEVLSEQVDQVVTLNDIIPQFTLNNVCETAMGVKLDNIPGSESYRKAVHDLEPLMITRMGNPIMYYNWIYALTNDYRKQKQLLSILHDFSSKIIKKKREEFQRKSQNNISLEDNDLGKKQRYAMLDTLLDAETKGLIDHQGICDEVNTFMFEGYDTTSTCLMFTLVNLAIHQDIQKKCFEEIQGLDTIDSLTVFDFNKLEYLECVIKESLRLYPSVPFLGRLCVKETVVNGLVLPANSEIHLHTYNILRDEKHFPNPDKFEPERFLPENTTNRHPFAFIAFSAGPRNCIGQKFAMLEMKVLLVAILKNFELHPVTYLEDLTFENGIVLRTTEKIQIKITKRQ